jgi:AcrR family transcriptional regulator
MAQSDTQNRKTERAQDGVQDRTRGRPQLRPDAETRQVIYDAARHEFAANGYAATSMEAVARLAGVSTKTLYRLIPNKASLFEGMVSDRLDRFLSEFNLQAADHTDIAEVLQASLMSVADLMLDQDVVALQRMILQETGKFSDLAGTFYKNGIRRTAAALADGLRAQQARGLIVLDDADEAAGMLIGMLSSAPQRAAIFGGLPMPSRSAIEARVRACVKLFLRGCQPA